ncbi:hypothetical protein TIFTF001_008080 [Ficus carica]|uniref:Uncharacterized protein n=1 Tax=Ficus carica TaxID=3494 RepID=A0AA87ZME4_FICCA|nr:hypothetical protein TIFTF001_008080 [Ficus carica]
MENPKLAQYPTRAIQTQYVISSDATIDIKLPRRSLLVQFTCDLCGERTQRLVNRLAYERGLIYVQVRSPMGVGAHPMRECKAGLQDAAQPS